MFHVCVFFKWWDQTESPSIQEMFIQHRFKTGVSSSKISFDAMILCVNDLLETDCEIFCKKYMEGTFKKYSVPVCLCIMWTLYFLHFLRLLIFAWNSNCSLIFLFICFLNLLIFVWNSCATADVYSICGWKEPLQSFASAAGNLEPVLWKLLKAGTCGQNLLILCSVPIFVRNKNTTFFA